MRYIRSMSPTTTGDDWSTRHSVQAVARRTAALVNVLDDESVSPEAVADVLRAHGETGPLELSARDLTEMRAAATALREVFTATEVDLAAATLGGLLGRGSGPPAHLARRLHPWHPHLDSADEAPWGEWFLASSCLALTVLVWDRQRPPGGVCASSSCRNVHLTQGSGPQRRYCSRRCATRERVAAHRARAAEHGPRAPGR